MLLSKRSQFMALMLVAIHGWASANESSKQPPLELPKSLIDGEPVAVVEKDKVIGVVSIGDLVKNIIELQGNQIKFLETYIKGHGA
ncbi:MAG: hypothetical protein EBW49_07850 [Betaproteobacteria bacterium]|nr:hypothetical protein [Betaproteobacteria bacterium]